MSNVDATLSNLPALPTGSEKPITVDQARELLLKEIETERSVNEALEQLYSCSQYLDKQVLRSALREYESSTGLLDDHPRLCGSVCGILGVTSLAAGIYGAVLAHGPVHHLTETIVGAVFGHGILGTTASFLAVPFSLFLMGIPVLGSSVLGPIGFGAIKVLGGKIVRTISPKSKERFAREQGDADMLGAALRTSCDSILEGLQRIQPLYAQFMDRNETLRAMASTALRELPIETQDRAIVDELQGLSKSLGLKEFASGIRLLALERTLRLARETEFRSPELRETSQKGEGAAAPSLMTRAYRVLDLFRSAFANFALKSQRVGTQAALNAAEDLYETCDHTPTGVLDPITAAGSSAGRTLHIALETGVLPEKALLDAFKGALGLVKSLVAGGRPEGPSLASLTRVFLELEEIERGNRVRWLVKLGPSVAFALLKKPALLLKAQKLEEASGRISPEMLEAEYANSKGRAYSAWKSSKEIGRLITAIVREGGYRLLIELPLTHVKDRGFPVSFLNKKSYTKGATEFLVGLCGNLLTTQEHKHCQKLQRELDTSLTMLADSDEVRRMDSEALTKYAVQRFMDYRFNASTTVSDKEITSILSFWKLKETAAWYTDKYRTKRYRSEIAALHPRLASLHDTLHVSNSLRAITTETLGIASMIGSKLRDPSAQLVADAREIEKKALVGFLDMWNRDRPLPPQSHDTIIDCGTGGTRVVLLTRAGTLELLEGAEGRRRLLDLPEPAVLPRYADHVRVATAEMLLATALENYQREALLAAHSKLLEDPACTDKVVEDLLAKSFTRAQLGVDPMAPAHAQYGVLSRGVIGR
jgi:hypothetical protein